MTCRCGRDNDARRSYCGGCGRRIGTSCGRCQFVNCTDDAFCGGCGDTLEASAAASAAPLKPVADKPTAPIVKLVTPVPAPVSSPVLSRADTMSAAELASLVGKAAAPAVVPLPSVVSQDDLDRLFGGVS
ncbi:MAG TPA: zinc ribbon domain-containing protein [Kofleriaceae bacterium]|nr:zinc ribbon domain-containing protein [Kofleriaceae bacterium]